VRTLLAGERTQTQAAQLTVHLKLEVQNASGTWKDVGALLGADYVVGWGWNVDLNQAVSDATFKIRRKVGIYSLSPLMVASALNVDDTAAYAPLLDIGRLVRASTATVAAGVTPTTEWREGFMGRIDTVQWEADPITITCSDLGAWLMDTQVEVEGVQFGTLPVGTALETVIQNIVNAWPSGMGTPTLYTPTSPGYLVTSWAQGRTKVMDAIRSVALQSTGWDVRYRYDASHVSRLTLTNPDRTRVTVDTTIGPSEYQSVRALSLSIASVRNAGLLPYTDASGLPQTATASDAISIAKYGRRYFELASSNAITTSVQANALIAAVVSDLAGAPAEQEIVTSFLWFVQLYDRYTFTANGVHYDQDQTLAVVGYRHEGEDGVAWTTLRCAGRVVGAYADWLRGIALKLEVIEPTISAATSETATTGTLVLTPTDPQGRLTRVQMATASGNSALSAYADVPLIGGVYTGTVPLVEKQPSKIAWRMYATVGASEQLQDGDVVRFAIGGIPLAPEVSYQIDVAGLLTVVVKGDSSTTNNRVLVATDGPPTDAQVDASTSLVGRNSSVTRQLAAGEKFYIGAKSYNTALGGSVASQGSPLVPQTDQWLGPSSGQATVTVGATTASPTTITLFAILFGSLTTHVNVYVREYRTDPGAPASVVGTGYRLGPPKMTTAPILIPVAAPSNYIVVTLEAVDALNRVGAGTAYAVSQAAGTLTLKIQAAATPGTTPGSISPFAFYGLTDDLVTMQFTMPATLVPATVRVWRNGIPIKEVTAPGAGAVLTITDRIPPGSYVYEAAGVSALGIVGPVSAPGTPLSFNAGTLPTPSLVASAWDASKRGFDLTVTPGVGMLSSLFPTWVLEHSTNGTTFTEVENSVSTTIFHAHDVDGTAHNHYFRVSARAYGWTTSAVAYDGGGASPGTNRPIPATA
jgi:hypothetical protein